MNPQQVSGWGPIAVSVLSMLTFIGALLAAFFMRDPGLLNLAVGAAIANATTVIQFWVGSSNSSQHKDQTIEKLTTNPPAEAPVAIAVSNPAPSGPAPSGPAPGGPAPGGQPK